MKNTCKHCYGKGYSTEYVGETGGSSDFTGKPIIIKKSGIIVRPCNCQRGKDIKTYFDIKDKYKPAY